MHHTSTAAPRCAAGCVLLAVVLGGCSAGGHDTTSAVPLITGSGAAEPVHSAPMGPTGPTAPGTAALRQAPAAVASVASGDDSPSPSDATPLATARAYVSVRWTYRYDDPVGYTAAVTAPALTTAEFAARSRPDAAALQQLRLAREVSTVRVGSAVAAAEAPSTAVTRYVDVAFTGTASYRGASSDTPVAHVWTLRLVRDPTGRWRVDAVVSTD